MVKRLISCVGVVAMGGHKKKTTSKDKEAPASVGE
jgi:hypothetical protein